MSEQQGPVTLATLLPVHPQTAVSAIANGEELSLEGSLSLFNFWRVPTVPWRAFRPVVDQHLRPTPFELASHMGCYLAQNIDGLRCASYSPMPCRTASVTDWLRGDFSDPEKAREYLESVRWPVGPICPHCGNAPHRPRYTIIERGAAR